MGTLNVRKRKKSEDLEMSLRAQPEWWWGCDKKSWRDSNSSDEVIGVYCSIPAEELTISDIIFW